MVFAYGGGNRGRARGQSETVENSSGRVGRMNGGKDSQAMVTTRACQHIQGPDALHQFRPLIVSAISEQFESAKTLSSGPPKSLAGVVGRITICA